VLPGGVDLGLSADEAAGVLRRGRPRDVFGVTRWRLAVDLVGEVRRLDGRTTVTGERITASVREPGTTLTELFGIGGLPAGKILARVGSIRRFASVAAFASYTGTDRSVVRGCGSAPVVAGGESPAQLCAARHGDHPDPSRHAGRAYYRRKRAAGKSHKEALRCLKRGLSDVVYRRLVRDARAAGPGGHPGADK
jgi:transposase